jgi:hypothetical protein
VHGADGEENREEGKQGRQPVAFEGARVHGATREKGGGRLGAAWGQEKEWRGAPAQQSAAALSRQAWAMTLLCDRGGRRSEGDVGASG